MESRRQFLEKLTLVSLAVTATNKTAIAQAIRSESSSRIINNRYWVDTLADWNRSPDADKDGKVGIGDFLILANSFNNPLSKDLERFDFNRNGLVDFSDFMEFIKLYRLELSSVPPIRDMPEQTLEQVAAVINPLELPDVSQYISDPLALGGQINHSIARIVNGLYCTKTGDKTVIRPFGTFSGETRLPVVFEKDGRSWIGEMPISVQKNERAMQLYNETRERNGDRRWHSPPEEIYMFTKIKMPGDPNDPNGWTGSFVPDSKLALAEEATKNMHGISSGFFPENPNIQTGDNANKIYHESKAPQIYKPDNGIMVWAWKDNLIGIGNTRVYTKGINLEIASLDIAIRTDTPKKMYDHEASCHGFGLYHPETTFTQDDSVHHRNFYRGNLESPTNNDKFVVTAHCDLSRL